MFPEHEHRFPPFAIELLEQHERLLFKSQASLLISMNDIQGVLPPVIVDLVAFERHREDFVARVLDGHPERLENLYVVLVSCLAM